MLLICASALFAVGLDTTVLQIAVPALAHDLAPGPNATLWILDSYALTLAALLVPAGACADRFGHRAMFATGVALFAAGSATGALAATAGALIAARMITGAGAALLLPSSLRLIRRSFGEPKQRIAALGIWTAAGSIGSMAGPVLSGALLEHYWWGAVFVINLPLFAVLLPAALRLVRADTAGPGVGRQQRRVDLASVVVGVPAMFGLVYCLKSATHLHFSPALCAAVVTSLTAMVWFVRRQHHLREPLLDLSLFRIPGLATSIVIVLGSVIAVTGVEVLLAQYFQYVLGLGPFAAGLRVAPLAIGTVAGGLAGAPLAGTCGPRAALRIGLGVASTAAAVLAATGELANPALVGASLLCLGAGVQVAANICSARVLSIAPATRAGAAGALDSTAFELGSGLGVAIPGVLAAAYYTAGVDANAGLSPALKAHAHRSIAAAFDYAAGLPAAQHTAVIDAARHAFGSATHICVALSGCLLLMCWAMSARRERSTPSLTASAPTAQPISTTSSR
ncbi:hypothetical protein BST20_24495 [Mycobacterium branderi]|uniref:MFS transporter n=1 Tax=Mycobacterium branderi TaxID=43348 RepID=A0A7I7WH81_9MYCO|nr:hypothetical protein BST20_24495 [Mycobacterium branderi]BBZ15278.1 MFS transporter [Mycobacterium branderi]